MQCRAIWRPESVESAEDWTGKRLPRGHAVGRGVDFVFFSDFSLGNASAWGKNLFLYLIAINDSDGNKLYGSGFWAGTIKNPAFATLAAHQVSVRAKGNARK